MPYYLARRNVQGATAEDMRAAGFRAYSCVLGYRGMRWLTSIWDQDKGEMYCVYEARSAEDVADHAKAALLPLEDVRLVEHINPQEFAGPAREGSAV
jgi:hypothetical protein